MRARRKLFRLDQVCLGASPEKLAQQREIPAVDVPALSEGEQELLYRLNYRNRWPVGHELSAAEESMRQKLIRRAHGTLPGRPLQKGGK